MEFELNYSYYSQMSYKENVDFHFKFILADKLSKNVSKLIIVNYTNFYYAQNS